MTTTLNIADLVLLLLLQSLCLDRLDLAGLFIRFSDRDKFLFASPNILTPVEKYSLCSRAIVLSHYLFRENVFASNKKIWRVCQKRSFKGYNLSKSGFNQQLSLFL